MELKELVPGQLLIEYLSFNRTIVELKESRHGCSEEARRPFNRTIVELKEKVTKVGRACEKLLIVP